MLLYLLWSTIRCHNYGKLFFIVLHFCHVFQLRAKLFRGKKIYGDYDIKVEQVSLSPSF